MVYLITLLNNWKKIFLMKVVQEEFQVFFGKIEMIFKQALFKSLVNYCLGQLAWLDSKSVTQMFSIEIKTIVLFLTINNPIHLILGRLLLSKILKNRKVSLTLILITKKNENILLIFHYHSHSLVI